MTTTNHTVYACGDDGCGLGLGFQHWNFYHWGIGFYHWGSPCCGNYWGHDNYGSCCNSVPGPGPLSSVGSCSGCGDDQIPPGPAVSSSPCCDDGYNTQWKTYQSNQQTTNNYVTVNGNGNDVNLNQNQKQAPDQLGGLGGPWNIPQPQLQGCCTGDGNGPDP